MSDCSASHCTDIARTTSLACASSATRCDSQAASARSAVRRWPNSSCNSRAMRCRSSSCNVNTCWLSTRRWRSAASSASASSRNAPAIACSSPIGIGGSVRKARASSSRSAAIACSSERIGRNARCTFQPIASSSAALPNAPKPSSAARLVTASARSLSCETATVTVHDGPPSRGSRQDSGAGSCAGSSARCTCTSHDSGALKGSSSAVASSTAPAASRTVSARCRVGSACTMRFSAGIRSSSLAADGCASRDTSSAIVRAAATSCSMSSPARCRPSTSISSHAPSATQPARRITRRGRSSGRCSADVIEAVGGREDFPCATVPRRGEPTLQQTRILVEKEI